MNCLNTPKFGRNIVFYFWNCQNEFISHLHLSFDPILLPQNLLFIIFEKQYYPKMQISLNKKNRKDQI